MAAVVIDTNVLLVADGRSEHMTGACQVKCIERLAQVREIERVVLDWEWHIMGEYQNKLDPNGKPTVAQTFLKWMLQAQGRVDWVSLTATNKEATTFVEFPDDPELEAAFDPADRKFVAAANAHPEKPPIVEAADSKWLGWEARLKTHGILLEVLCRDELELARERKGSNTNDQ
jgi:hypothetical protein